MALTQSTSQASPDPAKRPRGAKSEWNLTQVPPVCFALLRTSYGFPPLLSERQLADKLNISVRTLQAQRQRGGGIPYLKVGRAVRYTPEAVERYLAGRIRTSTSQDQQAAT